MSTTKNMLLVFFNEKAIVKGSDDFDFENLL
jgi:hypothetical protein